MTFRDVFIITFTLFVGFLSGMYLYFTAYKPAYVDDVRPEPQTRDLLAEEYSIIGIPYGGMVANYVHPNVRIQDGGSYRYYPGGQTLGEEIEGTLPRRLALAVEDALKESDLSSLAEPVEGKDCRLFVDGIEYEYNIVFRDVEYELDTCATALDHDDSLAEALEDVWRYLESPDTFSFSVRNMPQTDDEDDSPGWLRGLLEHQFIKSGFDSTF